MRGISSELVENDVSTQWLADSVSEFKSSLRVNFPPIFTDYVRIFHPAYRTPSTDQRIPVAWETIGRACGSKVSATVEFSELTGLCINEYENGIEGEIWNEPPAQGTMPQELTEIFQGSLARHTASSEGCWFGAWEGWNDFDGVLSLSTARLRLPYRNYVLFRGPLSALGTSFGTVGYQTMNLCWPEKKEWFLATDIDAESTYIGGSAACIAELLKHPGSKQFE